MLHDLHEHLGQLAHGAKALERWLAVETGVRSHINTLDSTKKMYPAAFRPAEPVPFQKSTIVLRQTSIWLM